MLNIIRTCPKRAAHCRRTIENLMRSNGGGAQRIMVISSTKTPNENGLDCIQAGVDTSGGKPFVFLEDDVDFIADFDKAAEQFHRDCEGVPSLILPLCANYPEVMACRGIAWRYPIKSFYGTQAFIMTPSAGKLFLEWTKTQTLNPSGFDLLLRDWALSTGNQEFLTPTHSFVQHMGVDSTLHRAGNFHYYPSWPGPDWRYTSSAFSLKEQTNRPCDKALAAMIADFFGTDLPAYDFGCSTGNYVRELRERKIHATGFDATPGIAGQFVAEVDLSRPQKFDEPPGNVMCLEVAEHIHPQQERHLIENITNLCCNKLVLSWAIPGQGGNRHVNEQPRQYVIPLVEAAGFRLDMEQSTKMRGAATIPWFKNTLYAFTRS